MRKAISGALAFLLGAALTALIVLDMVRPQNPWTGRIKGEALRLLWDRQSPLACGGNAVMVLRDYSLDLQRGPVFEASGRCQLHLIGVKAKAPRALVAGGDARVIVEGGRLEGKEAAVEAGGSAVVELRGATLDGPVRTSGEARVEGAGGGPKAPADPARLEKRSPPAGDAPKDKAAPLDKKRKRARRTKG